MRTESSAALRRGLRHQETCAEGTVPLCGGLHAFLKCPKSLLLPATAVCEGLGTGAHGASAMQRSALLLSSRCELRACNGALPVRLAGVACMWRQLQQTRLYRVSGHFRLQHLWDAMMQLRCQCSGSAQYMSRCSPHAGSLSESCAWLSLLPASGRCESRIDLRMRHKSTARLHPGWRMSA